jgi:hypothetical protein
VISNEAGNKVVWHGGDGNKKDQVSRTFAKTEREPLSGAECPFLIGLQSVNGLEILRTLCIL